MPYNGGYHTQASGSSYFPPRQSIIQGPLQNQHIRFTENEHPPREPRAMKRERSQNSLVISNSAENGTKHAVASKRIKLDGELQDSSHRRGTALASSGASGQEKWGLQIKGASHAERFPHNTKIKSQDQKRTIVSLNNEEDELDCIIKKPPGTSVLGKFVTSITVDKTPIHPNKHKPSPDTANESGKKAILHPSVRAQIDTVREPHPSSAPPRPAEELPPYKLQDVLEELAQCQSERQHVEEELQKYQNRETALEAELVTSQKNEAKLLLELQSALRDLETNRLAVRHADYSRNLDQEERTRLMTELESECFERRKLEETVEALVKEKGRTKAIVKRLRNDLQLQDMNSNSFSLDAFQNTLDQVSEAHVKCNGRPSVESINDAIDVAVLNVLEQAAVIIAAQDSLRRPIDTASSDQNNHFLVALAAPGLTEDNRGLLLDAHLHSYLILQLYNGFFQGDVATFLTDETKILDAVFSNISNKESWAMSQRWRALAASGLSQRSSSPLLKESVKTATQYIVARIAWAYGLPATTMQPVAPSLLKELTVIFRDAHELSIVIKRDILSVRMSITVYKHLDQAFEPAEGECVWSEMGVKPDDIVIGYYGLGLEKRTETGEVFCLTMPRVITAALLRQVDSHSDNESHT